MAEDKNTEEKGKKKKFQSKDGNTEETVKKEAPKKKEYREQIMRLSETNLDGNRPVAVAIRKVRGIGAMMSSAIVGIGGFEGKKLSELTDEEQKKLEDMIANPGKYGVPTWMFNRRKDPTHAKDRHISVSELIFQQKLDINELKKIKCYRGIRHSLNLTVRGQRTRGAFRKSGKVVGVSKKKVPQGSKK